MRFQIRSSDIPDGLVLNFIQDSQTGMYSLKDPKENKFREQTKVRNFSKISENSCICSCVMGLVPRKTVCDDIPRHPSLACDSSLLFERRLDLQTWRRTANLSISFSTCNDRSHSRKIGLVSSALSHLAIQFQLVQKLGFTLEQTKSTLFST